MRLFISLGLALFTLSAFSMDEADHQCRIFTTEAVWNAFPGEWQFSIRTPNKELYSGPTSVKVALQFHGGNWEILNTVPTRVDRQFRYYSASYRPSAGGHTSMSLNLVSFVQLWDRRLYDHNWHGENWGYISLNRSNNWSQYNLSSQCR